MRFVLSIVVAVLALSVPGTSVAQALSSRSTGPAVALVKLMAERGIDAAAARDPKEPGRFIAALCFPGTQLLVVSAKYPAPAILEQRLSNREYRDVYMELQGDVTREGRFFVQDMQANGLSPRPESGAPIDSVYENGVKGPSLDGDWKAQRLSKAAYEAALVAADRRYGDLLAALIAGMQASK